MNKTCITPYKNKKITATGCFTHAATASSDFSFDEEKRLVIASAPNPPGPCVCKYDTNMDAHLQGPGVFHFYRN